MITLDEYLEIEQLARQGISKQEIAHRLGIDRRAVLREPIRKATGLFRPLTLPHPYTSTKDIFCLRETRRVNGYRKISLLTNEIEVPGVPLREEVEVHLAPDVERTALEVRIWWDNRMVQSVTYPLKEFP
jgi:hypothetical protein